MKTMAIQGPIKFILKSLDNSQYYFEVHLKFPVVTSYKKSRTILLAIVPIPPTSPVSMSFSIFCCI